MKPVKTSNCRDCGAIIVWMKSKKGKNIPVNVDSVDESDLEWEPASDRNRWDTPKFVYGTHEAHFNTCPNRQQENHTPPSRPQGSGQPELGDDDVPF